MLEFSSILTSRRHCGAWNGHVISMTFHVLKSSVAALAVVAFCAAAPVASAKQSRGYAVSWFFVATYLQDDDCPDGTNPMAGQLYTRILKDLGYTPAETAYLLGAIAEDGDIRDARGRTLRQIGALRGRIDGQEVDAIVQPYAAADPHIHLAQGRYANGFNLDDTISDDPRSSEDPDTHELGVDNRLRQTMGCTDQFRTRLPDRPGHPANDWDQSRDKMPAWLMTVTGDDLGKDGDVIVTFDRALEPVRRDANGEVMPDVTFRVDPDAHSHSVAPGRIANGRLVTTAPFHFVMTADPSISPTFEMHRARLRVDLQDDRSLKGYFGGYRPWQTIYFTFAGLGAGTELTYSIDLPGLYHAMKRMADYDPDPKTGQMRAISSAYRIELVPAFVVPREAANEAVARR
jgi:hypothetical protein